MSDRYQARLLRAQKRMSHRWHLVGVYFDIVDGRKRRKSAPRRDQEDDRGNG
jgi:hypothetical protein